ncbi:polysaccharide deacetylase family protein [Paenibacillus sp. HWE-109]|uniref:polysaccharide deacetylase family protein n=1 Tax=Paenibacillus sp. HWE-109 TaxID=1306526 RepID=UPI001EDD3C50|nr:polysaccharide deacetylase family protein [Paenibacillus sp. HWE-109]UKS27908.1 polysaccharide deacetylase family protein [Paenibacillus sp. HWE-109]
MRIRFDLFPGGKSRALTLSYDDGREFDRRMVRILNDFDIRGTFHLNSGLLGKPGYLERSEVKDLFSGHEVSTHTVSHPFLSLSPKERIADEILQDRKELEHLAEYPVKGLSYPHGSWNKEVVSLLPALGVEYARTTNNHGGFDMPEDFLLWSPTCHHRDMLELGQKFLDDRPRHPRMSLLYVWGHSYEFNNNQNWEQLERFGELIGRRPDIWYATNIEIVLYIKALRQLRFTVSGEWVHNPSALSVWFSLEGQAVEIKPGETKRLFV